MQPIRESAATARVFEILDLALEIRAMGGKLSQAQQYVLHKYWVGQ